MIYEYSALIAPNGVITGMVKADNQTEAVKKVANNHLFCESVIVTPSDKYLGEKRINIEVFP